LVSFIIRVILSLLSIAIFISLILLTI
jgi:hypothetical protein